MLTLVSGCTIQVAGLQTISEKVLHVGTGKFVGGGSGVRRNVSTSVFQLVSFSWNQDGPGVGHFNDYLVNGRTNIGETIQQVIPNTLGEQLSFQKFKEISQISLL